MYKKTVCGIMVTLLLACLFPLAISVKPTKGEWIRRVYIRADGSIDPSSAPIVTYDNVTYVLTDNITSSADGIVVERDNIVIDGAGYTLQGTKAYESKGVVLSGRSNVTIKNIIITKFCHGILLNSSSHIHICGNSITANDDAITLRYSSNNSIIGNNLTNNTWGISLDESSYNRICRNSITANEVGLVLFNSSNNCINGNNIIANGPIGILLEKSSYNIISWNTFIKDGLLVLDSYQNSVENNTVNGKPLLYLEGVSDQSVSDAGQLILVNCIRIRVENLNISNTDTAIELLKTNNTIIRGNNIIANDYIGILLEKSSYNCICGNNVMNSYYGVFLSYSLNNIVSANNVTANEIGLAFSYSSNNSIAKNNLINNGDGVSISYSLNNIVSGNSITANDDAITLRYSSNNIIVGNNVIANNSTGVSFIYSSNNSIAKNNLINNGVGISLIYSSNNSIYHNNFINNTQHVHDISWDHPSASPSINIWNVDYPSGGNYWSNYAGVDVYSGSYQNETGSDGIGDTAYVIYEDNTDKYPLMGPSNSFNTSVGYFVNVISNSTIKDFRYFKSNSTIVMHISNMTANQTAGFCRLTIPHEVMSPPYMVKVNGTTINFRTIYENRMEGISIIYFTYKHSNLEVTITSKSSSATILLLFVLTTIVILITIIAIILSKRKGRLKL